MAAMRDFEAEAARAVGWVEHHVPRHHGQDAASPALHHPMDGAAFTAALATQTPAPPPVNLSAAPAAASTPQEDTMSELARIEDDVKGYLTDGLDYMEGMVTRLKQAAPGIIQTAESVGGSTIGALVEAVAGRVLPPQLEEILAAQVKDFIDRWAPQAQAPSLTQAPAQPVPAGQ